MFAELEADLTRARDHHVAYVQQARDVFEHLRGGAGLAESAAIEEVEAAQDEMTAELEAVLARVEGFTEQAALAVEAEEARTVTVVSVLAIAGMVLGLLAGIGIIRSVTRPTRRAVALLTETAQGVSAGASQVSEASEAVAQAVSEQAASQEETASAMEELSANVRANAEHSSRATELASNASGLAQSGTQAMGRLIEAVAAIQDAAQRSADIIRSIDEIAFQTNLLSLNASVEAARAGSAGKGFAIVADEVRSLATRSAEAARHTSELLTTSQTRSEAGVDIAREVESVLEQMRAANEELSQLITAVGSANDEQSRGIDQVNAAVAELDAATQSNAASSEECAATSRQLSAQGTALLQVVDSLRRVVDGARAATRRAATNGSHGQASRQPARRSAPVRPKLESGGTTNDQGEWHPEYGRFEQGDFQELQR